MAANTVRAPVSLPFTASAELDSKGVMQKHQRHPSRKALENAIQDTTAELSKLACSAGVFRERIRMHFDRAPSWILTRERLGDRKKVS